MRVTSKVEDIKGGRKGQGDIKTEKKIKRKRISMIHIMTHKYITPNYDERFRERFVMDMKRFLKDINE